MEDILNSIKTYLYDRASSPLLGAFIISWLAWNYRFVVILISSDTYKNKFNAIDQYMYSHGVSIPWAHLILDFYAGRGLVLPLLTALAYIYIYPVVAEPVYEYSLTRQKRINDIKKKASSSRIIDEKESRKLFKDLADMQSRYDDDISQYQRQVKSLKEILDEKNTSSSTTFDSSRLPDQELHDEINKNSEKELDDNDDDMNDHDVLVLKTFHEYSDRFFTASEVRNILNAKLSDVYSSFKKLEKLKFISKRYTTDSNEHAYMITNNGHEYLGANGYLDN